MNVQTHADFTPSWDIPKTVAPAAFRPRRLGHANIFVRDLEPALHFYNKVCGFREVAREPGIHAGFLTNGNTHHDLGIVRTTVGDRDLRGRGGHLQVPKWRGRDPGLNHFGWEMETEAELVNAFWRAVDAGYPIHRTTDHQVSHSVYLFDPDGNQHEIYADAEKEWWKIMRGGDIELISGEWRPGATPPTTEPRYHADAKIQRVEEAPFHPARISRAVLTTRNFDLMRRFLKELLGLTEAYVAPAGTFVCYRTAGSPLALSLFRAGADAEAGLHHVCFELPDETDFADAAAKLAQAGVVIEREVDTARKRSVFLKDPSGTRVELYHDRRLGFAAAANAAVADQPFLV